MSLPGVLGTSPFQEEVISKEQKGDCCPLPCVHWAVGSKDTLALFIISTSSTQWHSDSIPPVSNGAVLPAAGTGLADQGSSSWE